MSFTTPRRKDPEESNLEKERGQRKGPPVSIQ
jgi:hypothetical protein